MTSVTTARVNGTFDVQERAPALDEMTLSASGTLTDTTM